MSKKLIYICSPCRGNDGNYEHNITMAQEYCQVVMMTLPDYIPIAPHVYFTQFLDDTVESQRQMGMDAGIELLSRCDAMLVFYMQNPSAGMRRELKYAEENDIPILDAEEVFRDVPGLFPVGAEIQGEAAAPTLKSSAPAAGEVAILAPGVEAPDSWQISPDAPAAGCSLHPSPAAIADEMQQALSSFQKSAAGSYLRGGA